MYRIQYYNKNGNYREIHGFKTPKEAENYVKKHSDKDFGEHPLVLYDSEQYA